MLVPLTLSLLALSRLLGRAVRRVEVSGDSMRPNLLDGDRLMVVRNRRARVGAVVVVDDERVAGRVLVKRVAAVGPEGVTVLGDDPGSSTDSRHFGPVARISGRAVYRYHPAGRAGRVR